MLTPHLRVSLLMDLICSSLRDEVLKQGDETIRKRLGKNEISLSHFNEDGHLDAASILKIIRGIRKKELGEPCSFLIKFRNNWAHQKELSEEDSTAAVNHAIKVFQSFGFEIAVQSAQSLTASVRDNDLVDLRKLLVDHLQGRTAKDPLPTYSQVAEQLAWKEETDPYGRLIRALNGLGGWQRAVGEPVLCALVVLGEDDEPTHLAKPGIPGHGFYWLVGLPPDADLSDKEARHRAEVERVLAYNWDRWR